MDYLRWYRRMIDVPIENGTELVDIGGDGELSLLTLRSAAGRARSRRAASCWRTDATGSAAPTRRRCFAGSTRASSCTRSDEIDFARLRGKMVGVLGAGSSACDSAAEALEHGAARAAMLVRRADVPRINKDMGIGSAGFWVGFTASPMRRNGRS